MKHEREKLRAEHVVSVAKVGFSNVCGSCPGYCIKPFKSLRFQPTTSFAADQQLDMVVNHTYSDGHNLIQLCNGRTRCDKTNPLYINCVGRLQ